MRSITYPATFPDRIREVKITELHGGHGWQVFIDKFYEGTVRLVRGQLVMHLSPGDYVKMAGDDIAGIIDRVTLEF